MNCKKADQNNNLAFSHIHEKLMRDCGITKRLMRSGKAELRRRVELVLVDIVNAAQITAIEQDRGAITSADIAGAMLGKPLHALLCCLDWV